MTDASQYGSDDFGQGGLNDRVAPDELLREIDLDRSEIQWRKDFIGFGREDVRRLESYQDVFAESAEQIADDFYDNLTDYEETMDVIGRSPKSVEQLKRTQSAYLVTLVNGDYGRDYFRNRACIGKLHDLLDMPMKHYLGQYGVYYDLILPLVGEQLTDSLFDRLSDAVADGGTARRYGGAIEPAQQATRETTAPGNGDRDTLKSAIKEEVDDAIQDILSLLRVINLDMQVVTDTYIHSYNQNLQEEIGQQREIRNAVETSVAEADETAGEVANRTDEINDLADSQAAAMDDVSSEVANMSATIEQIASTAEEVADTSSRAAQLADEGRGAASEAISVMERVTDSSREASTDVEQLQERIAEIDEIVEVINDIAEQTNMLALNASIEAARAGEAGEGFAVVADEVKSLAEKSQEHAREIEERVAAIQTDADQTVESLDTTITEIDRGVEEVEDAAGTLQEIANAVDKASSGIQEVSDATDDQAASTEEVASMVDDLVEQADQVAEEIEGVAAANDQQAEALKEIHQTVQRLANA